jgi:hypothetical protein
MAAGIILSSRNIGIPLQTITDDVSSGRIDISTPDDIDDNGRAEERVFIPQTNEDITPALDGKRYKVEFGYRPDTPPPLATPVTTVDDGPPAIAPPANDNKSKPSQINELFKRGELGIDETLNRRHFHDAMRFISDHTVATSMSVDQMNRSMTDQYEQLAASARQRLRGC